MQDATLSAITRDMEDELQQFLTSLDITTSLTHTHTVTGSSSVCVSDGDSGSSSEDKGRVSDVTMCEHVCVCE